MRVEEAHQQMRNLIIEWDPFQFGEYETEIADIIQAVHKHKDPSKLGKEIQVIFEHSFEKWLPLRECQEMARKLLFIKEISNCT
ncbi:uncharacterized protein DUF1871 [Bacillus oleivorans]|uniref:Uncharacterized protein DUF1871 n=1 Tax=Bacillus oleivorans TaxID=1448271 RepID=A0A285D5V2_9BACI|nr:DUF1871 family protein [Bacillus oleivorans]SNX75201.1 uncharacterized protein DUF1871 [Bacillus oleivorans]